MQHARPWSWDHWELPPCTDGQRHVTVALHRAHLGLVQLSFCLRVMTFPHHVTLASTALVGWNCRSGRCQGLPTSYMSQQLVSRDLALQIDAANCAPSDMAHPSGFWLTVLPESSSLCTPMPMRDSCNHPQPASEKKKRVNSCCCTFPAAGRRFVSWWYPRGAENRCGVQLLDCESIGRQNERKRTTTKLYSRLLRINGWKHQKNRDSNFRGSRQCTLRCDR